MPTPAHPFANSPDRFLPCCVEAPNVFLPRARYAVEMLLFGLGLEPTWVEKEALSAGGVYYGSNPEGAPERAVCIRLKKETHAFFSERRSLELETCGVLPWDGEDWFLPFGGRGGEPPDVIASTFFWLSGWQEHTTVERDRHGRFQYVASLQAKLSIALHPLVDVYRAWLGERLSERGVVVVGRTWNGKSWAVALTHDIDFVETRKRSRLKSFVSGKVGLAFSSTGENDRRRYALSKMKAAEAARHLTATYFIKGGASSPEDIRYSLTRPWIQRFVEELKADGFDIGLHPSYAAYDHPSRLQKERDVLQDAVGGMPESVRTHFLRWMEPITLRILSRTGFLVDSTLGFSEHEGFRRATCHPFRLFDIAANRPLDLWEMPLAVMDTTLFSHRGLSAEEATRSIQAVFNSAKRVGGCAVVLWHNTLYDEKNFPGQAHVFERTIDSALVDGAFIGSLRDVIA